MYLRNDEEREKKKTQKKKKNNKLKLSASHVRLRKMDVRRSRY